VSTISLRYRHLRRRLRRQAKRAYASLLLRLFNLEQRTEATLRGIWNVANHWLATVIALIAASLFMLVGPSPNDIKNATEVHLACAGIIGGALALILSLSIIPAQKAAEAFSAAILKLYARDATLLFVFALLSTAVVASVLLGTGWTFRLSLIHALAAQIVLLGLSFDGIRFFYRKTLDLLLPATATGLVLRECNRSTKRVRRSVERAVRILQIAGNPPNSQAITGAVFYAQSQIAPALRGWIAQLDEFAHKAIVRGDTQAVNEIVTAMQTIGTEYADARRSSLILMPDWDNILAGGTSDISRVLNPIYESVRLICQHAAKEENELVVCHCIRTFGAMTEHAMTILHEQNGTWRKAPLAFSPCFYLDLCVQIVIRAGMADAILAGVASLQAILLKPVKEVDTASTEAEAIQSLCAIAAAGYLKPELVSVYPATQAMLFAARHAIAIRGYRQQPTLKTVLTNLALLAAFEIVADKAGKRIMQTFPAYSLGFEASIPALLEMIAHHVQPVDPARPWVNPFHEFLGASEDIVHHYRDLAKLDFQGTLFMKWVIDSMMTCAKVHIALLDNPPTGADPFRDDVDNRLRWYIYAPSFFFRPQNPFPSHHAEDTCGELAILGMHLMEQVWWRESAKACGVAIGQIAESCAASQAMPYALANLHEKLEILARAADALGYAPLATEYRALIAKPAAMTDDNWAHHIGELATRIRQLDDELEEYGQQFGLRDDPVSTLRELLARHPQPEIAE